MVIFKNFLVYGRDIVKRIIVFNSVVKFVFGRKIYVENIGIGNRNCMNWCFVK